MFHVTLTDEARLWDPLSATVYGYVEVHTALELAVTAVTGGTAFTWPECGVGTERSGALHSIAVSLKNNRATECNVKDCHQKNEKTCP